MRQWPELITESYALDALIAVNAPGWVRREAWGQWLERLGNTAPKPTFTGKTPDSEPWDKELDLWERWMTEDGLDLPPYVVPSKGGPMIDDNGLYVLGGLVIAGILGAVAYDSMTKRRGS